MSAPMSGPVRYRFQSDGDEHIEVIIEGQAEWVLTQLEELELDDVGFTQPLPTTESELQRGQNFETNEESEKERDMGPPPDPSRIPIVKRPIGSLNLEDELDKLGVTSPEIPDAAQLSLELADVEEPPPAQGVLVNDPMAEAWLRELLRLAVRSYGVSALSVEVIEEAASSKLGGREGMELELWLESLFRGGKLVRLHGGDSVGYGPTPRWLEGKDA